MALEYRQTTDPCGIEVVDTLEQISLQFCTSDNRFAPGPTDVSFWEFVDETIAVDTRYVTFESDVFVGTFDGDLNSHEKIFEREAVSLPFGTHIVSAPTSIKLYLLVTGSPEIRVGPARTHIEFETTRRVVFGFRSEHSEPTATVKTTSDPSDIARAITALSGEQPTSPDATWPALRRYPPRIELDDELAIPADLDAPEASIEVVVPPRYGALFSAAPMAHYLGARLVVGESPALVVDGETISLGRDRSLQSDIERTVRRTFFLDGLSRTASRFNPRLPATEELRAALPFDLEWAYDASISDRLRAYMDVPFEMLEPEMPRVPLVAHLPPVPEHVSLIPHILYRFGFVRPARGRPTTVHQSTVEAFVRESCHGVGAVKQDVERYVDVAVSDDALANAWFGPGIPTNAAKGIAQSYEHALQNRQEKDSIDVLVVCTDRSMLPEQDVVDEYYDKKSGIRRKVSAHSDVSRSELSRLLEDEQYDLFHFIGHATERGLECRDGFLDVAQMDTVGVDLFVLNACETYQQGVELVSRGAVGGVGTNVRVSNRDATVVGQNVSRLLSEGFSLSAAVEQATIEIDFPSQYLVLGECLAHHSVPVNSLPAVVKLDPRENDTCEMTVETNLRGPDRFGQSSNNVIDANDGDEPALHETFFDPGCTTPCVLPNERVADAVLSFGTGPGGPPVRVGGKLHWPVTEAEVEDLLE
ncbi:hypothetical protein [Haloarchaeobius sp. TZWSO28]|uniref:hypothetical protein n=1 Tax=Haloarchaeobius sp. TZWSO28 TaxID=3446119 RepID=UPI003EBFE741